MILDHQAAFRDLDPAIKSYKRKKSPAVGAAGLSVMNQIKFDTPQGNQDCIRFSLVFHLKSTHLLKHGKKTTIHR